MWFRPEHTRQPEPSGEKTMIIPKRRQRARWFRIIRSIVVGYCIFGLLVETAVPHILPENAFTTFVGDAAKAGVFTIWF